MAPQNSTGAVGEANGARDWYWVVLSTQYPATHGFGTRR